MYFNVFEAAPENDRDGPTQQAAQTASGKVRYRVILRPALLTLSLLAARIFPVIYDKPIMFLISLNTHVMILETYCSKSIRKFVVQ